MGQTFFAVERRSPIPPVITGRQDPRRTYEDVLSDLAQNVLRNASCYQALKKRLFRSCDRHEVATELRRVFIEFEAHRAALQPHPRVNAFRQTVADKKLVQGLLRQPELLVRAGRFRRYTHIAGHRQNGVWIVYV